MVENRRPALLAINEMLREECIRDSARGIERWNKIIRDAGIDFQLHLPHRGFNRRIGEFAGMRISPEGEIISEDTWRANESRWLPTAADHDMIASLMRPVLEPGQFASWIGPPARGINHQPLDFEYVRLARS